MISIAIVANSTHGGGAENSMMLLHSELNASGYKSSYFALNVMGDEMETCVDNVVQIGRSWSDGLSQTFKHQKRFKEEIESLNPDVLLVNCELPELFAVSIRLAKVKMIVIEHTTRPWNGRRMLGFFVRLALKVRGASWVTVNSEEKEIWPFSQPAVHIPNPVRPVEKRTAITREKSVVFVGRLRKEKCPELVVQACLESSTPISLFGDGILNSELQSRYGESKLVEFFGYLDSPWSHISLHSLVVVSSEYEGDGLVVLEALQNGNPILLRDIADLRRFNLKDENYFKDQAHLTDKLREFRANPSLFTVPDSERDRILSTRDTRVIAKKWATLIEDLVEGER
jgi:glycosyltransferase involved in cell wall biosynthesis